MTTICAIRTHRWGSAEQRLFERLLPVFGDRLVTAFHNPAADLTLPLPLVEVTDAFLAAKALLRTDDWGWRCGDYFLYALRDRFPDADHYWLIEPDVYFTSAPDSFFSAFASAPEDALGSRVSAPHDQGRFTVAMADMRLFRATFALTRVSGRGIDCLLTARQAMTARGLNHRYWPNDEFFVYTILGATPGMTIGSLETHAPDWFNGTTITPSPDHLLDAVIANVPPGRVIHPVHDRAGFMNAIVGRFVDASEFLARHRASLAHLTDDEIDLIAFRLSQDIRQELHSHRGRYLRRHRQAAGG